MTKPTRYMVRFFAITTLAPVALLAIASIFGGIWGVLALVYMTAFAFSMDALTSLARDPENPEAEFPAADTLSVILALAHFPLLGLLIWSLSVADHSFLERLPIFFAHGLFFGQVSNSNAHELIHRGNRWLHELGRWVFTSLLFGHHSSAHPKVHHFFVATPDDPNSAPKGMSYYRFLPRAWLGSFWRGLDAENQMRKRAKNKSIHPYVIYCGGALGFIALAYLIGGFEGAWKYVLISLYASSQLMLSDYVQHYGLRRKRLENGKYEPVGAVHSWNAPKWFTSLLMLNAPRHSDHHAHPMKPYIALEMKEDMPELPRSLPLMAMIAMYPPLWTKIMDPRVDKVVCSN